MKTILWILAIVITSLAAIYQRATGPSYPKKISVTYKGNTSKSELIRNHEGNKDATVTLNIPDTTVKAKLYWKHYPSKKNEQWNSSVFKYEILKEKMVMTAKLPWQPPAGKLMYYVEINDGNSIQTIFEDKPVIIRFKGSVPLYVLIPHIIFIFVAMLIANLAGLFAAFKQSRVKFYTTLTLILIFIGGLIFGPIVQKYAFGEFWAGVPRGWDLTDNKLLIAFIAWLIAFILNRKKENRTSVIIAAIVTFIIFIIPHSMFGSELDRETGKVIQGMIFWKF